MGNIRLGIVGTNFVSDWMCEAVKMTDGIDALCVFSRSLDTGRSFAEKHSLKEYFTDFDAFVGFCDAVYIASPNFCHATQIDRCLEKGKHVLVEKCAVSSVVQWEILLKKARDKNLVLMEAMRPVHDPKLEKVREYISKIGQVRGAFFEFCQYSSRYDDFKCGVIQNAFRPEYSNAAVMDLGCYAIATCIALFGAPTSVKSNSVRLSNGFEGSGTAILSYPDMFSVVSYSKVFDSYNPSVILGEEGSVALGKLSLLPEVSLKTRKESETFCQGEKNNMVYILRDFVKSVENPALAHPFNKITFETISVIDKIREQNGIVFPEDIELIDG